MACGQHDVDLLRMSQIIKTLGQVGSCGSKQNRLACGFLRGGGEIKTRQYIRADCLFQRAEKRLVVSPLIEA